MTELRKGIAATRRQVNVDCIVNGQRTAFCATGAFSAMAYERIRVAAARDGKEARIVARMNSLSEPSIIRKLYEASQAGVQVDLIIRGACCLRPGMPGISENIRVRSVVGRFLEHSRIYAFHAAGEIKVFLSSADWMSRNLFRRVETCFPVKDARLRQRLVQETLEVYLKDNQQAWASCPFRLFSRPLCQRHGLYSGDSLDAVAISKLSPWIQWRMRATILLCRLS